MSLDPLWGHFELSMKYHIEFDIDFRRNISEGLIFAVEGIDGSGKTTQVERLVSEFQNQGKEVVMTANRERALV